MLRSFYLQDAETDFIQSVVNHFPIPIYPTVRKTDYVVKGAIYIYDGNIIKCTSTGILSEGATYNILNPYYYGSHKDNITKINHCPCTYYDGATHRALGDYLRTLRDCKNINLMQLYNCFDYTLVDDIKLITEASLTVNDPYTLSTTVEHYKLNANGDAVYDSAYNTLYFIIPSNVENIVLVTYDATWNTDLGTTRTMYLYTEGHVKVTTCIGTLGELIEEGIYKLIVTIPGGYEGKCIGISCLNSLASKMKIAQKRNSNTAKSYFEEKSGNYDYKIVSVPIKFNKTYTLAVDSPVRFKALPVLWCDNGYVKEAGSTTYMGDEFNSLKPIYFNRCSMSNPSTFYVTTHQSYSITWGMSELSKAAAKQTAEENELKLFSLEKYLRLFIELPLDHDSSIVVLEGDYSGTNFIDIDNIEFDDNIPLDLQLKSKPELTLINDGNQYAYSEKLIQYLLQNAITSEDVIEENIGRIQDLLEIYNYYPVLRDAWDDGIAKCVYELYMKSSTTLKQDVLGFIDKQVEKFLYKENKE